MKSNDLRRKYLNFFKSKGHVFFRSDTLVPDDPTVLFTSAGMNQFKPYFLGEKKEIKSAVSCQKCLRTGDLDEVGKTPFHHTFFEMLGNFSFGGYFKKQAIEYAWEFMLKEMNIKAKDLWVSVYKDDDEAYDIWKGHISVPPEKIAKLGEKDNFWPANAPTLGPNGPCGPCSEIFFDRGESSGCGRKDCGPACDCRRFVEVWNLVFTQFNRAGENLLEPLPQKNIDTGMGLERMAAVLQEKYSNFEIDILSPAVTEVRRILRTEDMSAQTVGLVNAIVDHARAATFAVSDGVYPSNEERGYVVRKIIRKAVWSAHLLNRKDVFLFELVDVFADLMKEPYPEINEKKEAISKVILSEEEKFLSTLKDGRSNLSLIINGLKEKRENTIGAEPLFRLYDTYGFPVELSKEIAKQEGMRVDAGGFEQLLKEQQERSRKGSMFDESIFKQGKVSLDDNTEFVGYTCLQADSRIIRIIRDGKEAESLREGEDGFVILDKTPFYPESGGQLTDKGVIDASSGQFAVEDVSKIGNTIIHKGTVTKGTMNKDAVCPLVDEDRRHALARAHTATHLLQAALRKVLGDHVAQQGSFVDEDRLRFDFTHLQALTSEQVSDVEELVNLYILKAVKVDKRNLSFDEAKKEGALAFFKDKYGDTVRVVSIAGYSKELCGGTHLENTSEICLFSIVSESSISSGVRRIEAITGAKAQVLAMRCRDCVLRTGGSLNEMFVSDDPVSDYADKWEEKATRITLLEKEAAALKKKNVVLENMGGILDGKETVNGVNCVVHSFSQVDSSLLLYLVDMIKSKLESCFVFLLSLSPEKNIFICSSSDDLAKKGITARNFVSRFRDELGLKGGGKDSLVQGVGLQKSGDYTDKIKSAVKKFLSK